MSNDELPTQLDYELFILATMVDAPDELTEEALRRVGSDRDAMWYARQRVEERNYIFRPAFGEVSEILGPPLSEEERNVDGRQVVVRRFSLRLWNDFDLEVYGKSDGLIWDERFVRKEGSPVPQVDDPGRLRPWMLTTSEVQERFGPLEMVEQWSPYAAFSFEYASPGGTRARYEVAFSRSLLQRVLLEERLP